MRANVPRIFIVFISFFFTWGELSDKKKREDCDGDHEDVHEEDLGVEALVELHDLDGLIEHGVEEEVALQIPERKENVNTSEYSSENNAWVPKVNNNPGDNKKPRV